MAGKNKIDESDMSLKNLKLKNSNFFNFIIFTKNEKNICKSKKKIIFLTSFKIRKNKP